MAIVNGDILRIAYRWNDPYDMDLVNVFHFRVEERGTDAEEDFLLATAQYGVGVGGTYFNYVHNGYDLQDAKIDRVAWIAGKEEIMQSYGIVDLVGYAGGSGAGDVMPPGCSPLMKWRTTGVKTLARTFAPMVSEADSAVGGLSTNALNALQDWADAYLSDIVLGGGVTGTIRRVVHSLRGNAWLPFIVAVAEKYVAYQRRRRQGVGS